MKMKLTVKGEVFEVEHVQDISATLDLDAPDFITFDTETTGLHLKADRPTLGAVCIDHRVFVFPMTKENGSLLRIWSRRVKRVYGHNVVFDMNMLANCMQDDSFPVSITNWGDTMCLTRLSLEAISPRDGGDKLGLKFLSKKYITPDADQWEKTLKDWKKKKAAADNKILTAFLKPLGWSYTKLIEALKINADVPVEVLEVYENWRKEYPRPTYADVPMDVMLPYVATDVIYTQFLVYMCLPEIMNTDMVQTMEREFKVLPVVYKMERVGLRVDRDYLVQSQDKMIAEIKRLYTQLHEVTGMEFTVGQHQVIKKMYTDLLGEEPESTDKKFLKKMANKGDEAAALITRIRRLEKWLATYCEEMLEVSEYDGRFYTSMSQFTPVSGRFSGNFQQMPKDPILDDNGNVIFHPRKAIIPSGGDYGKIFYMDFSQVELRVQAHYTMSFGGDVNLCRAYMPFKCRHYITGEEYDHTTVEGRAQWNELKPGHPDPFTRKDGLEEVFKEGWSAWINPDTNEPWVPTDVHSSTTIKALIAMGYDPKTMDEKTFKWWRYKGKTFNFMRNYGGGDAMAAQTLEIDVEAARAMNRGYTESFPLVITYQNNVVRRMRERGYCVNMHGRRYYVSDWNKHYKVANYLIQGSCADDLKEKMIKIDMFLQENSLKTRMVLCIHDELIFEVPEVEEWTIPHIKGIMEDTPHIKVPIVAEVEYTSTAWSEKNKYRVV